MWFLFLLSMISLLVQALIIVVSIAAGLYYLAELVEEYTVIAKYVITWLIIFTTAVHAGLIIFEDFPLHMNVLGLFMQAIHGGLLRHFPVVKVQSLSFVSAILLLCVNHYFAFSFFRGNRYNFTEVLAYFTLCLWVVPFAFIVSLSANDNVLPTTGERQHLLGDSNVVDYISNKTRKYNLLSVFTFAKESILPQRHKKAF